MEQFDLKNVKLVGTHLIEAGAGTGKTYNITGLYLRLLLEKQLNIDEILVVTFTKAATRELKERIRGKIHEALHSLNSDGSFDADEFEYLNVRFDYNYIKSRLTESLREFDEASIFTIHGFCQKVLYEYAFETGGTFNAEMIEDQSQLILDTVEDFWRKTVYQAPRIFIKYLYHENYSPARLAQTAKYFSNFGDLNIIPDSDYSYAEPAAEKLDDLFIELKTEWQKSSTEIAGILREHDGISRQKYRAATVETILLQLGIYLNRGKPDILFKNYEKLTSEILNESLKKGYAPIKHRFFELFSGYAKLYGRLTAGKLQRFKHDFIHNINNEISARKKLSNSIGFDDLLSQVHGAVTQRGGNNLGTRLAGQFKAALIDEFQDTDSIQYEIFQSLFSHPGTALFLIGDPRQSIYSFRGADIFTYFEATEKSENRWTLLKNWRSTPGIINAVNKLLGRSSNPFLYDQIRHTDAMPARESEAGLDKPELRIWYLDSEAVGKHGANDKGFINTAYGRKLIAGSICPEIINLITSVGNRKAVKPQDIAVLVNTNKEARLVRDILAEHDIPGTLYSDSDLFETDEAYEILLILKAIAHPDSGYAVRAALATDIMGYDAESIRNLFENDSAWDETLLKFRFYNRIWRQDGFLRMTGIFTEREIIRQRLIELSGGRRRLTNVQHLFDFLSNLITEKSHSPETLISWLSERILSSDIYSTPEELKLDSDDEAIRIMTIHKSKGLEFPVVFCPFTWGSKQIIRGDIGIFHDPENNHELTCDLLLSDKSKNQIQVERLAESLRMFYVAVTRARFRCYLIWGRFNRAELSPMNYLLYKTESDNLSNISGHLKEAIKTLTERDFLNAVNAYTEHCRENIEAKHLPRPRTDESQPLPQAAKELKLRNFEGSITTDFKIASYSYFSSKLKTRHETPDHETLFESAPFETEEPDLDIPDVFSIPKGAKTGIMIHEIMEELDFTNDDGDYLSGLVGDKIGKFGFDPIWVQAICNMITATTSAKLPNPDSAFTLRQISTEKRINEMQFFFPIDKIAGNDLKAIFEHAGIKNDTSDKDLRGSLRGFMQGFIDCTFEIRGRYYIIDWKTNHLGDSYKDYSPQSISNAMIDNIYTLQYLIYSVALDKYLRSRISNYDYENHFGGVYYLFMRGVKPADPEFNGIFYDKPDIEKFYQFKNSLTGVAGDE